MIFPTIPNKTIKHGRFPNLEINEVVILISFVFGIKNVLLFLE